MIGNRQQSRLSATAKLSDGQGKNISILRRKEPKTLHFFNVEKAIKALTGINYNFIQQAQFNYSNFQKA